MRTYRHIELSEKSVRAFWKRVDRRGANECWPWTGHLTPQGYGAFAANLNMTYVASRVSWFLANGEQPAGHICHSCDNPACVNPSHLWVGDDAANVSDMMAKGRSGQASKTHCRQGHAFDEDNTYRTGNRRICRACNLAAALRLKARKAA